MGEVLSVRPPRTVADDEVVSIVLAIESQARDRTLGVIGMTFLALEAARVIRRMRPDLVFKEDC